MDNNVTPLLSALRACSVDEQYEFARLAGTTRNYLYQLATCHRKNPSLQLAQSICDASARLHRKTAGRVPSLTTVEIAAMCAIAHTR
jgi:DNA-binding XRE family transcriptional regulator